MILITLKVLFMFLVKIIKCTLTEFVAETSVPAVDSDPLPCSPQVRLAVALLVQPVNNVIAAITEFLYK